MIKHLEVDGVPTVLAPTAGTMHAGLAFRVGRADETLARGGITHLIEHLVLHPLGLADYHYNGVTGTVLTNFHMQGSESDVAGFLTGVCATLTDLPMHRLETEKEILRTEAAGRGSPITDPMTMWRYGARDYGLQGYPEWGLNAFTPDDLRAWVARFFTRENAVLWIAGDAVPAELSLRLPPGSRQRVPRPSSALPVTPAYFPGSSGAVAWTSVVRRSAAAGVLSTVLERELFRALRQESGLSYTTQTDYDPRGDEHAVITAVADALPSKQDAVLGGFIDVLAKVRVGRIEPADVEAVVTKSIDGLSNAEVDAARLPGYAFNMLVGWPNQTVEEKVAELRAVTVDDVRRVAGEALGTGLLMTPENRRADWAGFVAAPAASDIAVPGTAYQSLQDPQTRLIVGPDGVTLHRGDELITVRHDACSAVLAWPDGARVLIGHDAVTVRVEPTLYAGVAAALASIDAQVPPQLRVDMPARAPDDIPQPQDRRRAEQPRSAGRSGGGRRAGTIALLVLLWPLLVLFTGMALLVTLTLFDDPEELGATIFITVVLYALAGLCVTGVVRATRRLNSL